MMMMIMVMILHTNSDKTTHTDIEKTASLYSFLTRHYVSNFLDREKNSQQGREMKKEE